MNSSNQNNTNSLLFLSWTPVVVSFSSYPFFKVMILDVWMGTLPCPDKYIVEDEILLHLSIQLTLHAKDRISACWIGWSTHWHKLLGSPLLILCGVGHFWRTDHFPFQIIVECEIHCWWTCQNPTNFRIWSSYLFSQWSWALNEVFITSATTRANVLGLDNLHELLLSHKLFLGQIHLSVPPEHGPSALFLLLLSRCIKLLGIKKSVILICIVQWIQFKLYARLNAVSYIVSVSFGMMWHWCCKYVFKHLGILDFCS